MPTAQRIPAIAARGLAEIVGAPTCDDTTGRRHLCHRGAYPVTLELIASSPGRLGDVLELRHAIESLAAHYAALRRTTADKSALRKSYKTLITSHAQRDPSLEAQADADFHLAIAEASHNVVLVQVMRSLFALLHSSMRFSLENLYTYQPAIFDNLRDQHYHLLNAILDGDPEQARVASDNHINYVEKSLAQIDAARSPQVSGHAHFSDTTPI